MIRIVTTKEYAMMDYACVSLDGKNMLIVQVYNRVRPRLFDQVGHETMYDSSGNKHFFN